VFRCCLPALRRVRAPAFSASSHPGRLRAWIPPHSLCCLCSAEASAGSSKDLVHRKRLGNTGQHTFSTRSVCCRSEIAGENLPTEMTVRKVFQTDTLLSVSIRCVKIVSHERTVIYWRFMGGFGKKNRHRKQPRRPVQNMQNLQYPYLTWVCNIALIPDAGS
jgi:hypothetical protein